MYKSRLGRRLHLKSNSALHSEGEIVRKMVSTVCRRASAHSDSAGWRCMQMH